MDADVEADYKEVQPEKEEPTAQPEQRETVYQEGQMSVEEAFFAQ